MKSVVIHDQEYEYLSWEQLGTEMFELSKKIIESGKKFDRVVALAKGGLTLSRSLVDFLDIPDISTIQIEFYTGIGSTQKTPVITQSLPVSVRDQEILIFDDIVDRGETMKMATEYLKYHGVKSVTTASLVSKPWTSFPSDFWVHETKAWIIFPNESRETIELLTELWKEHGDSLEIITENLLKIGFPKAEVEFFAQIR
jgi:hypoxanthine phosphoribosyltransferase